jgi:hypothetical protein
MALLGKKAHLSGDIYEHETFPDASASAGEIAVAGLSYHGMWTTRRKSTNDIFPTIHQSHPCLID